MRARRPLRICYLADVENLIVRRYTRYFVEQGCDVHIVHCPMQLIDFEPTALQPGLTVHRGLTRPSPDFRFSRLKEIWNAIRTIRGIDPDIVHLLCSRASAQAIAGWCGRPVVFTPWGADILHDAHVSPHTYWRTRWLLGNVRGIVAGSHAMLEHARRFTGPCKSLRAQWGVDFDLFRVDRDRTELRRELDLPNDAHVLFSPRQWGSKYNIDTILRALPPILEREPRTVAVFKYCIVQPDHERMLMRLIDELGVRRAVRILGPSRDHDTSHATMAKLFAAADAFISIPTWDGGTPATIFEGMASGCHPIVSDIDTNTEYVTHGVTGSVVPARDHEALAGAVAALHENPTRTFEIARNLPGHARRHGTYEYEMGHVLEFYRSLVAGKRGRSVHPTTQETRSTHAGHDLSEIPLT